MRLQSLCRKATSVLRAEAIILAIAAVTGAMPVWAHPEQHRVQKVQHRPLAHRLAQHVALHADVVPEHTTASTSSAAPDLQPVGALKDVRLTGPVTDSEAGPSSESTPGPVTVSDRDSEGWTTVDPDANSAGGWRAALDRIQDKALSLVGIRYRRGGNSPANGFDCSGFVQYVLSRAAGVHLARSAAAQASEGKPVALGDLHTGDLVFFHTFGRGITHVGLYLGHGDFIHAPSTGEHVRVENINQPYWQSHYVKAVRPDNSGPDNS
ncbi:C40 family peptidase [Paraburkholderia adhaesiva]|uniref:C40 family peptidase n=1 Tax=Paraburkholderia adhaesiva TaxID=2883244 RepID=UPI001F3518B1|nr:C40 family peptidase [Paraburkholderia adhaesiva]